MAPWETQEATETGIFVPRSPSSMAPRRILSKLWRNWWTLVLFATLRRDALLVDLLLVLQKHTKRQENCTSDALPGNVRKDTVSLTFLFSVVRGSAWWICAERSPFTAGLVWWRPHVLLMPNHNWSWPEKVCSTSMILCYPPKPELEKNWLPRREKNRKLVGDVEADCHGVCLLWVPGSCIHQTILTFRWALTMPANHWDSW